MSAGFLNASPSTLLRLVTHAWQHLARLLKNAQGAVRMAKLICPKYAWLFLIISKKYDCTSIALYTMADTEEEARGTFPCWNLTFAAKIRIESSLCDSGYGTYGLNSLTPEMLEVYNV